MNQAELEAITPVNDVNQAREKACEEVTIGFCLKGSDVSS